ncbi:MAG: 3-isopropylmalate dehydratase large subunit [Rhodoplanes sp.]|uniref:3-isopropylmalate dehydratase large subunit n=1 Tax=Rhodoplanes sp. TaxID=1968906 RepID=UPI0017D9ED47|nr:3-isopropylmalate dehydratase large subunit [Rhodoplanes sp.]NVO15036.1 3-isopropylmalate dehydratase large subunit [Rhodoplanes sp.]
MAGRTVIDRIWDAHVVAELGGGRALLHIDRIFLHERMGPALLGGLAAAGRRPAQPGLVFGVMDHTVDTKPTRSESTAGGGTFIETFRQRIAQAGIRAFDLDDPRQGIVHVVSPEQGIALPGCTLVCPDSHTCTLGGIGALAWGIGSTEGEHAVATQTLVRPAPRRMQIRFDGRLGAGVGAKDLVLALIARFGVEGGQGCAIEFTGEAVRALGIESRLTLCNMTVEFGAWTGLVAPDDTTIDWIAGRPFAPEGAVWDRAVAHWRTLVSDDDAVWDETRSIDASTLAPQLTWGTSPEQAVAIDQAVPDPADAPDRQRRAAMERALAYMDLQPGAPLLGTPIEAAFIGSCTNSRLPDLREAAAVLRGRKVAVGLKALVVPGSMQVRAAAEAEGLDRIFTEAGFEWRKSGCSLCFFSGADDFGGARRVISTTNRNFEGRQGPGVRTHLASPATVAASAIAGRIADARVIERI